MKKKSLNYKDVHLVPNYSTLASRSEAKTEIVFGKRYFKLPVVPANMASTISLAKATWLAQNDYFYIMHRFYTDDEILNWMRRMNKDANLLPFISISIGTKPKDLIMLQTIKEENLRVEYITVDVAHGDHSSVYDILYHLQEYKKNYNPDLTIIGGNIATGDAFLRMCPYVDAVKIGIACGASCITYNKTGFASPMFSTVRDIKENYYPGYYMFQNHKVTKRPYIIADGGISHNGDIAKALVAGADMVMCGSIFARCTDSPAITDPTDPTKKLYFGSASQMNGNNKNIEGRTMSVSMNGMTYEEKLNEIKQDLASAISYAGGDNLEAFKDVEYRLI